MGFWLWKYFKSLKSFDSDAQTEVFDLPQKGIISNIILEIQATSGNVNFDVFVADMITKVEVIGNGSTVIQSLSGAQLQASQAYDDGKMPPDKELSPSGTCWGYFDIRFGRFPGDTKYALDCSRWDSLELKVTYAVAAGATIGTTGFTAASGKLSMYGLYSPDGAGLSPVGYLKKEQKKTYTSAADGSEDLSLPTDFPFRRLLLFASTHETFPYQAYQYVTINVNNGARKPIDNMLGNDLMIFDLMLRGSPMWRHWKRIYIATNATSYHPPIRWIANAHGTSIVNSTNVSFGKLDPNDITPSYVEGLAPAIAVEGYCPWGALAIDPEAQTKKDGVEAMLDAWGFDQTADIHLEHTSQVASIAKQVVLEQYAHK